MERRKIYLRLINQAEDLKEALQHFTNEEEDTYNDLAEELQETEEGCRLLGNIDTLNATLSHINEIIDLLYDLKKQ